MSWFSTLFSAGASKVVDSIGGTLDELFTSDEERAISKQKLEESKAQFKLKLKQIMTDFERDQMKHVQNLESELTERHKNDMQSDSWLSKNIRPMVLVFLTVATILLVYLTTFTTLEDNQIKVLDSWTNVLIAMLGVVYTFYFGSRGFEKITKIRAASGDKKPKG